MRSEDKRRRWLWTLRILLVLLVQVVVVVLVLSSREIVGSGAKFRAIGGRTIYLMSDAVGVLVYLVADVCVSAILLMIRRHNAIVVACSALCTAFGLFLACFFFQSSLTELGTIKSKVTSRFS